MATEPWLAGAGGMGSASGDIPAGSTAGPLPGTFPEDQPWAASCVNERLLTRRPLPLGFLPLKGPPGHLGPLTKPGGTCCSKQAVP